MGSGSPAAIRNPAISPPVRGKKRGPLASRTGYPTPVGKSSHNFPYLIPVEIIWSGAALVSGISAGALFALISQIGKRDQLLAAFPTPERFTSRMALFPDNRISVGKMFKAQSGKEKGRLATVAHPHVFSLPRYQPQIGSYLQRLKNTLAMSEVNTATAHKLTHIIHGTIKSLQSYDEKEVFKLPP